MRTKESKKIVKSYNRIARTIVEFETLWHLAWGKSIDASKAGLSATLLVRHPTSGTLSCHVALPSSPHRTCTPHPSHRLYMHAAPFPPPLRRCADCQL
jgi:hypothetical protein